MGLSTGYMSGMYDPYGQASMSNPYARMREAAYSGLGNRSPFNTGFSGMGNYRPAMPYMPGRYGNTMTGMGSYGMPSFKGGYSPFGYGGGIGQSIYGTMGNMQSPFPHGAYFLTPGGALGGMPQYQQQQYYGTTNVHPITGAVTLPPNTGNNV